MRLYKDLFETNEDSDESPRQILFGIWLAGYIMFGFGPTIISFILWKDVISIMYVVRAHIAFGLILIPIIIKFTKDD